MKLALLALAAAQYSSDQVCLPFRCVNPVFPAIRVLGQDFLAEQDAKTWVCVDDPRSELYLGFCRGVVRYDFAVPVAVGDTQEIGHVVRAEEDKALKQYFQHLSGLSLDAFDYRDPSSDTCSQSIWEMVCYAHFPKCNELQQNAYLRPCATSCERYVSACGVECCDESVTCSWAKEITLADGTQSVEEGFVAHAAPSALCTGMASSSMRPSLLLAAAVSALMSPRPGAALGLLLLGSMLQGCESIGIEYGSALTPNPKVIDDAMGLHKVGKWREKPDFSLTDSFKKKDGTIVYDSCSDHMIDTLSVCSGRGVCEAWDKNDVATPLAFCRCDAAWAGPECRSERKSQLVAFSWAVFGGAVGADHFYLGFPLSGLGKLFTFGGLGVWYLFDVFRIGVGPPYTAGMFRTAPDLPFWLFNVASVSLATFMGFFIFVFFFLWPHIKEKRKLANRFHLEVSESQKARPNAHLSKVKHLLALTSGSQHLYRDDGV